MYNNITYNRGFYGKTSGIQFHIPHSNEDTFRTARQCTNQQPLLF